MKAKLDTKTGLLILVAVLVIVLIIVYAVTRPSGQTAQGPTPTYATQGQLVAGFPPSLVLDSAAQISQSYSINYSASDNLYTAVWNSSSAASALFANYKNYFLENDWTITNQVTSASLDGIYAESSSSIVNATFVPEGSGSQATVGYAPKTPQ